MATTKTFLELVNDTIDEAGEDLASFSTDGSDFTTVTDSMMNRFKKWVQRAWRTIQQEQFDWEWMQSLAVVNITPGIMFYTDTPIDTTTTAINPAKIVDVDDSTAADGLFVSKVVDLTNSLPEDIDKEGIKQLGYMDLAYADYTLQNQHTLDFGLKAGGYRITRDGQGKFNIRLTYVSDGYSELLNLIAVGDTLTNITIVDAQNGATTPFTLVGAEVSAIEVGLDISYVHITYDSSSGDFWAKLEEYAVAQAVLDSFNIGWNITFNTTSGPVSPNGRIQWPMPGTAAPVGPSASISPFYYNADFFGNVVVGSEMLLGNIIPRISTKITRNPNDITWYSFPCYMTVDSLINSASTGILALTITDDGGHADSRWTKPTPGDAPAVGPFCFSLFSYYLLYSNANALATLTNMVFYRNASTATEYVSYPSYPTLLSEDTIEVIMYDTIQETTFTYSIDAPYTQNNWIHSWKSYKWSEEISSNDYVYDVREVDQSSYALIRHQEPAVTEELPLEFLPWSSFDKRFSRASMVPSQPVLVTEDPTGRWQFYPPIDMPYTIKFKYGRQPQELVLFDDIPKGIPDEYVDMIMWRALQYYGEYDEQPSVANRGRGNYKNLLLKFERQTRPKFYFKARQLY